MDFFLGREAQAEAEVFVHSERGEFHFICFPLTGMDVYGYLMAREGHLEDVEVLGGRLFNISDQHAEPWVISG